MGKYLLLIIIQLLFIFATNSIAKDIPIGQFFLLERGSRQEGMGNTWAALSDDYDGIYGNPAGISLMDRAPVFGEWFTQPADDGALSYLSGGGFYRKGNRIIGFSGSIMNINIPGYDTMGNPIENSEENNLLLRFTLATFEPSSLLKTRWGANVKYLRNQIKGIDDNINNDLVAADIGMIAMPSKDMRVGVTYSNFGFKSNGYSLPTVLRLGISFPLATYTPNSNILLSADYETPSFGNNSYHFGGEAHYYILTFRMGVVFKKISNSGYSPLYSAGVTLDVNRFILNIAYVDILNNAYAPSLRIGIAYVKKFEIIN
jgi:hypothetical protein